MSALLHVSLGTDPLLIVIAFVIVIAATTARPVAEGSVGGRL
jgi:hypothetical protein